jgi:ubiquinone biosynthesis protein UbiJ
MAGTDCLLSGFALARVRSLPMPATYNAPMFEAMTALAERSVMERVVLAVNHVVRAEPAAMARLAPHAGRTLVVDFAHWPVLLPALPSLAFRVTPAGLVEWLERPGEALGDLPAQLRIEVDASNPARMFGGLLVGERPRIAISGDAAFAGDVQWLADNLRWDVEEDLARAIGDAPAHAIAQLAGAAATALRQAARTLGGLAERAGVGGRGAAGDRGASSGR